MDVIDGLFFVFYVSVLSQVTWGCMDCHGVDMMTIQERCSKELSTLSAATSTAQKVSLCSNLVEVYYCVGEQAPQCLLNITDNYKPYHQTPHDCHLTPEVARKIQEFNNNKCITTTEASTTEVTSQSRSTSKDLATSTLSEVDPNCGTIENVNYGLLLFAWVFVLLNQANET